MKSIIFSILTFTIIITNSFAMNGLSNRDLTSAQRLLEEAVYTEAFGNCGIVEIAQVQSDKVFSTVVSFLGEEYLEGIDLNIDNTPITEILTRLTDESFYKDQDNSVLRAKIMKIGDRLDTKFTGTVLSGTSFGAYSSNHQIIAFHDSDNNELLMYAEGNCE